MKIDVLGTSFVIQSDQDPSYLRDIVDFLKSKVLEIQQSVTTTDPLKISILAAMLVIDEYFKFKAGQAPASTLEELEAANIAQRLIRELDAMLERLPDSAPLSRNPH
jgi:cell division protein ZapA (FtsZ GTPase activity inhibitor)